MRTSSRNGSSNPTVVLEPRTAPRCVCNRCCTVSLVLLGETFFTSSCADCSKNDERKSDSEKKKALKVYERCRRERTEKVVARGNLQQHLYHVHDGPEQEDRDRLLKQFSVFNRRGKPASAQELAEKGLEDSSDPFPWRWHGVGKWLLPYECEPDVEQRWAEVESEAASPEPRKREGAETRAQL